MKKNTILIVCLIVSILTNAQAPKFVWAKNMSGIGAHEGRAMSVDSQGNIYTIGAFKGTSDFDPGAGTFNLSSAGDKDIFISKLNASGNFIWAKRIGGSLVDEAYNVAVDAKGNVYGTGNFQGTVDFDPGTGTSNLTPSGSFILKLDSSGAFVWARQMAATSGISIAVDKAGNVYATGSKYISKLNVSGTLAWTKNIGGTPTAIVLDASANIYTTGGFGGTVDFDPGAGTANITSMGGQDVFVARYDSSGSYQWARQFGGNTAIGAFSIAIDGLSNIYSTGFFNGTGDFNPGAGTYNLISNPNGYDFYISKLNSSGNFIWAKSIGGDAADHGFSNTVDEYANVYVTGFFGDTVDFDPGAGKVNMSSLTLDIYILKLDSSGNFKWARKFGGATSDGGFTLASDLKGHLYTSGFFNGTVDFDPDSATSNLTSVATNNCFLLKMINCPVIDITTTLTGKTIKSNQAGATYQWIDCNNGNIPIPGKTSQTFSPVVSGNYAVIVTLGGCSATSACMNVGGSGVADKSTANAFILYPNPTNGIFNITFPEYTENRSLEVYNAMGALILRTTGSELSMTIDLSRYSNGLYIVRMSGDQNIVTTQKLVKQ